MSDTNPLEITDLVSAKKHVANLSASFDFQGFVKDNSPVTLELGELTLVHVAGCLQSLCNALAGEHKAGSFVTAVSRGDYAAAIRSADRMNKLLISVYVSFVDEHIPPILIK